MKLQDVVQIKQVATGPDTTTFQATVIRDNDHRFATGRTAQEAVTRLCLDHPEVLGTLLGADEVPVEKAGE